MKRGWLSLVAVGSALIAASALAQTNTTGTTTDATAVADNTPTENLATAGARGPSTVVSAARARHLRLRENRLAYQRGSGDASDVSNSVSGDSGTGTGSSTGTDSLTDALGDLINSGGLGSLAGLLGSGGLDSLLAGAGGTSGTGGTTNPNAPNLPPEVLQMLQGAGIDINDVFPPDGSSSGTSKTAQRSQGASILQDRWPGKTEAVSQTTDDTEDKFVDRWKEQMALTFFRNLFTGITAGLSSQQFIENIEDFFRPILRPDSVAETTEE